MLLEYKKSQAHSKKYALGKTRAPPPPFSIEFEKAQDTIYGYCSLGAAKRVSPEFVKCFLPWFEVTKHDVATKREKSRIAAVRTELERVFAALVNAIDTEPLSTPDA